MGIYLHITYNIRKKKEQRKNKERNPPPKVMRKLTSIPQFKMYFKMNDLPTNVANAGFRLL